jgi:exonuclease III
MLSTLRPKRKFQDLIKGRQPKYGMVLGLLNIEGLQNSIDEAALILDSGLHLPNKGYLDVLGLTETFQHKDGSNVYSKVKTYTWYGKPSQKPVTSIGPRQGLGFWVKNHLTNRATIMEPNEANDNILWLRIVSKTDVLYIAVAYAPFDDGTPEHKEEAIEVFKTLKSNIQELQTSGTIILMGDLNARMPDITGDSGVTQNNKNGVLLKSLLKDSDLSVCVNQTQQEEQTHWTYLNPTEATIRKSIPDYILYPRSSRFLCNNYRVHPNVSCDSMHRLLTVRVNHSTNRKDSIWDPNISKTAIWSEDDIKVFKNIIDNELVLNTINTKTDITKNVTHLHKILKKAFLQNHGYSKTEIQSPGGS